MADLIGQTLGQYKLTARLGRGGMADVYKAFHTGLSVYRAIKVIRPEFVSSDDFRARFQKEAQAVASLRHPNIVQIHDFGTEDGNFYMVMEFIEGNDLKDLLKKEGRIRPISKVVDIIRQVASALDYAHKRNLIHRDIKPDNIMLNNEGLPILMDFGIAKLLTESTQLTQTGMGIGTPAYMAPEQAKAIGELGPTADIYALSIVLFEMLTGTQPFSADTPMAVMLKAISDPLPLPRTIANDISEGLEGIILKGAAKEPQDRYQSAKLLYEALKNYINVESEQATMLRESPVIVDQASETPAKVNKDGKGKYIAIGGILLLVAAAVSYVYLSVDIPEIAEPSSNVSPQSEVLDTNPNISNPVQKTITELPAETIAPIEPAVVEPAIAVETQPASTLLAGYRGDTEAGVAITETLTVSQGDVLFLDIVVAKPITNFSLASADGRSQLFKTYSDIGPITVKKSGEVQLSVLTRNKKPGTVDYQLWKLNPAEIQGKAIQPGTFSSGQILTPGQVINYTVELKQDDTLFLDIEKTSGTTHFSLISPDGRSQLFKSYSDTGPINAPVTGTYTLQADPAGEKLTSFEFTLYRLNDPQKQGGKIEPGKYVSGSTDLPGQTVGYTVALSEGDTIFFDLEKYSATTDFTLSAPGARKPVFKIYSDQGPIQVSTSGNYSLIADPRGDKLSTYEFTLYRLTDPQKKGGKIEPDKYASGTTEFPGQTVIYDIELSSGDTIFFDIDKSSTTTDFTLTIPNARKPLFKSYADKGPISIETSAVYSLIADPRGDKLSTFEFVIRKENASE